MNPLFRKQWVQGIISWQGVDRAQKHQFPRERKGSVTSESGTSQKEQTVSQTYQVPFPPQGLCTCYPHCAELCFLCPVLLILQSLAKWMPSPTPSQPLPGQVGSFLLHTLKVCHSFLQTVSPGLEL